MLVFFVDLILLFFAYSFLGWCIEVTLKYFQFHRFINRGFFTGPILPIYGSGAALITVAVSSLARFEYGYGSTFALSFVICGTLEYLTSYWMEKRFHARWWDYSQKPMNLHGRVWIGNLMLFGLGGVAIIHIINPLFDRILAAFSFSAKEITACVLTAVFAADYVLTHFVMKLVKIGVESSEADSTEEISKEVYLLLSDKSVFHKRFADAYPEVIYRTERITARLAEVKAETERLRAEAEQQLEARREAVADRLEPATLIKSKIISKQNDLIEMLYHEQTASEEIKALKSEIDREKERLEERPLGALASDRRGDQRGRRSS
ncbi:MAG: hypothetical protein II008_19435 [Oscillospiraceae bacterium]|jgi:uncharacterized membrane protein|nr:hypothetical protein [Oscillospiraceae bacterium]MBQ2139756.1 hypothetical protein [Acidaminococcaceae bacterium]MEE3468195.1 hypothetical protein [Eubacterium sp.]MBQ1792358.1 hypothetical protein [Oscillospiraceae bacterium]MBQ3467499.1 hypothetical protein [Oscillospiraceae bacterium]